MGSRGPPKKFSNYAALLALERQTSVRIKKLPMEERLCYLMDIKPFVEDKEFEWLVARLRRRMLIPQRGP